MKKHDIFDGVEYSPIGAKYWYENAVPCDDYDDHCGMFSRNCGTCMYHILLSADACDAAGINPKYKMYCSASVEQDK